MSNEVNPDAPAEVVAASPPTEIQPSEWLAAEGLSGPLVEIVMRHNRWTHAPLPLDELKKGLHRALHERI